MANPRTVIKQQAFMTEKGHELYATLYRPETVKATVLIVPAIGVSQQYYSNFASWLCDHGYLVTTFDYLGMGMSLYDPLKDIDTTVTDWAKNDCSAMVKATHEMAPRKPLYWIGHSLGGQALGFVTNQKLISKAITIAAGSGYWMENSPQLKRRAWLLWYFVAPIATRLFGYFPGKRLNMVGDLPKGVIYQWRRWCLHPEYILGVENEEVRQAFHSVATTIISISFTDDELMSEKNVKSLHGFYIAAPKTMIRLSPKEIGVNRIGHFGFFKEKYENVLWQAYLLPELT